MIGLLDGIGDEFFDLRLLEMVILIVFVSKGAAFHKAFNRNRGLDLKGFIFIIGTPREYLFTLINKRLVYLMFFSY